MQKERSDWIDSKILIHSNLILCVPKQVENRGSWKHFAFTQWPEMPHFYFLCNFRYPCKINHLHTFISFCLNLGSIWSKNRVTIWSQCAFQSSWQVCHFQKKEFNRMNLNECLSPLAAPPEQFWAPSPLSQPFQVPWEGPYSVYIIPCIPVQCNGSKQLSMNVLYYIFFGHMAKKENASVYKYMKHQDRGKFDTT